MALRIPGFCLKGTGRQLLLGVVCIFTFACSQGGQSLVADVYVPDIVTFAGDTIPISDPEIRERLERELWINRYWQSNTAQLIKKSGRWFPMIDSVLQAEGIPQDFKYLVAIESSFENVTSNKGAVGFWQFMEPTARELGLVINTEVDERLNPLKATTAAARLLRRGKNNLGHWAAVAASYNVGIQGLRYVMQSQYTDNYYDLLINQETGRYLFRALACKLIFSMPEKYGFGNMAKFTPLASTRLRIDTSVADVAYWCRQKGFTYKCFRQVNPWVKLNSLTISDSIPFFEVNIPIGCTTYTHLPLPPPPKPDSAKTRTTSVLQNLVNQKDMTAHKASEPTARSTAEAYYTIKQGENLSGIAARHGLTVKQLLALNPELAKAQNRVAAGKQVKIR